MITPRIESYQPHSSLSDYSRFIGGQPLQKAIQKELITEIISGNPSRFAKTKLRHYLSLFQPIVLGIEQDSDVLLILLKKIDKIKERLGVLDIQIRRKIKMKRECVELHQAISTRLKIIRKAESLSMDAHAEHDVKRETKIKNLELAIANAQETIRLYQQKFTKLEEDKKRLLGTNAQLKQVISTRETHIRDLVSAVQELGQRIELLKDDISRLYHIRENLLSDSSSDKPPPRKRRRKDPTPEIIKQILEKNPLEMARPDLHKMIDEFCTINMKEIRNLSLLIELKKKFHDIIKRYRQKKHIKIAKLIEWKIETLIARFEDAKTRLKVGDLLKEYTK